MILGTYFLAQAVFSLEVLTLLCMAFGFFRQDPVDFQRIGIVSQGQIVIVYLPTTVTAHETV